MKLRTSLPILAITLTVMACGKNEDAAQTQAAAAQGAATQTVANTDPTSTASGTDLVSFCNNLYQRGYWAQMVQASTPYCQASQTFNINYSAWSGHTTVSSRLTIYAGQGVTVHASGSPVIQVGGYSLITGSGSFVSQITGTLAFYSANYGSWGVSSVNVRTCYAAPNQAVPCPN